MAKKKFVCRTPGCTRRFDYSKDLHVHMGTHLKPEERRKYSCTKCSKSYLSPLTLQVHFRIHTGQGFKCPKDKCGKQFTTKKDLKRHAITHSEDRGFSCRKCNVTFKHSDALKKHMDREHDSLGLSKIFKCSVSPCSKGFKTKGEMQRHEVTHVAYKDRKMFDCKKCSRKYSRISELVQHKKEKHSKVLKTFKCNICKSKLVNAKSLKWHLDFVHGPKRNRFKCLFCPRAFNQRVELEHHVNVHLDQKPFICGDCGQGFHFPASLRRHRKNHQPPPKVHPCPDCEKTYPTLKSLRNHLDIHHGKRLELHCGFCEIAYQTKRGLDVHIRRIHTKEVPYKCGSCKYRTVSANYLNRHIYNHHNIEVYPGKCYFCGDPYQFLCRHMIKHTMEKIFKCRV